MNHFIKRISWFVLASVWLSSCSGMNFGPDPDHELRLSIQTEGLRDTLRIGRDTLHLWAEVPQPVEFYNYNRERFKRKQLPSGSLLSMDIIPYQILNQPEQGYWVKQIWVNQGLQRLPPYDWNTNVVIYGSVTASVCRFRLSIQPTEPGLYVLKAQEGFVRGRNSQDTFEATIRPRFSVNQSNHHLLNEQARKDLGFTSYLKGENVIAFYVK